VTGQIRSDDEASSVILRAPSQSLIRRCRGRRAGRGAVVATTFRVSP